MQHPACPDHLQAPAVSGSDPTRDADQVRARISTPFAQRPQSQLRQRKKPPTVLLAAESVVADDDDFVHVSASDVKFE